MANKNQLLRYLIIDEMLRRKHKKYPSKQELIDEIVERTDRDYSDSSLEKDLRAMRSFFNAPIEFHNAHRGYFYGWKDKNRHNEMIYEEDHEYRFMSISLSQKDVIALNLAESVLEGFKGLGLLEGFSDAIDKVLDVVEIGKQIDGQKNKSFIQLDTPPYVKGRDLLGTLARAIHEQKQVAFEYRKFNSETSSQRVVSPYILKEFGGRWYLVCYEEQDHQIKNFGLDRMQALQLLEKQRLAPERVNFDAENHFKHCLGVTRKDEAQPENIVLSFNRFFGHYIQTQPLHPTQQELVNNEEEYRICLQLLINHELITKILSFGENVKVLAPTQLAQEIKATIQRMLALYR
jgi:predicted DNA-binding transcriptional regulator YafY